MKQFPTYVWRQPKWVLILLVFLTCMANALAGFSITRQLLDQPVSVELEQVSMEEALYKIGTAASVKFAYSADQIDIHEPVTLRVVNQALGQVLYELFTPRDITYKVHEKASTITLHRQMAEENTQTGGETSNSGPLPNAAPFPVTGIVTDARQQPLAGVNIIIKGTATGTTTDSQGKFTLDASEGDLLVFSFIGYTTVEFSASQTPLEVTLEEDVQSLSELVVNAGYWEVNEREKTGNISRVSAREIEKQPVSNPLQTMQGRMPGVYIQQHSGMPGSNFTIRIRGVNSLANGNEPLYIVNGVPFLSQPLSHDNTAFGIYGGQGLSLLNSINPDDIESIEVLKDADATAIYGSRGANGVVLITTKKGAAGQWGASFNTSAGFSKIGRRMDLLNTEEYLAMRQEAIQNDEAESFVEQNPAIFPDLAYWDQNRYTDWQKELLGGKAGFNNSHLSFSGGGPYTQLLFSGGYQNQTSIFPGADQSRRASTQVSVVQTSPDGKFRAELTTNYSRNNNNLPGFDPTGLALRLAPNAPALYDTEGKLNWENSTWRNPLAETIQRYKSVTDNIISNAVVSYEILEGLHLKSSFGINHLKMDETTTIPSTYYDPALGYTPANARVNYNRGASSSWIAEPQASWEKTLGKLKLNVMAGGTFQEVDRQGLVEQFTGYSSDALLGSYRAASDYRVINHSISQYRYAAGYGRTNFNWDGKYIVNLTARRDGSSRFGPENRMASFGAVGMAWVFSNEEFAKMLNPVVSFGKLHLSYGSTGNDQVGDYSYLDTFDPRGQYQGSPGLFPTRLFNPELGWEINKKMEAGLSLGFFKDRATAAFSYYRNRSSNQLINYPLSRVTGFNGIQANFDALVQNTGLELEIQGTVLAHNNFSWSTGVNATFPENKLVSFPGLEASSYANRYAIGEPLTMHMVYALEGLDSQTGLYQFKDLNGDGSFTSADRLMPISIGQTLFAGFQNSLQYKGWELSMLLQFVKQQGANYSSTFGMPGAMGNVPRQVYEERWQQPGDNANIQALGSTRQAAFSSYFRYTVSDAWISDASFVRVKNVSVAYQLPETWLKGISVKWYAQGQNLATFSNYLGLDPESTTSSRVPPLFTIVSGLQIKL